METDILQRNQIQNAKIKKNIVIFQTLNVPD